MLVKYKVFKIIAKILTGKQTQLARADLIPSSESDLEAVACTVCDWGLLFANPHIKSCIKSRIKLQNGEL